MKYDKKTQVTVFKEKAWSTTTADKKFSEVIRRRDPVCVRDRCGPSSDCSHYWRRGHSATRFDTKNCVGLARKCHGIWEHQKNNEYRNFMIGWLGQAEYILLELRARSFKERREAVLEFQRTL